MRIQKKLPLFALLLLILVFTMNSALALVVNSVVTDELTPGQQGKISIEIENNLQEDAKEVSLSLDFKSIPFIPIGSSEQSVDEIKEDDEEIFVFTIKSAPDIKPGDYEVSYTLKYLINNQQRMNAGTLGIKVRAQPELEFTISTQNNVQNQKGAIELKIINKGFSDARFVSVKVLPEGFTLLSEDGLYIGTVGSDDFETVSFDVIFTSLNPTFNALVEYTDFDNKRTRKSVFLPVKVYSQEKAKQLGIIKPNYTFYYVLGSVLIIILIFVWRTISKRRKLRRSLRAREEEK